MLLVRHYHAKARVRTWKHECQGRAGAILLLRTAAVTYGENTWNAWAYRRPKSLPNNSASVRSIVSGSIF